MTKLEFILALNEKLSVLPEIEVNDRLNFYTEMIDERIEEGLSEEDAVAAVGSVDEIAAQILGEITLPCEKKKSKNREKSRSVWVIILLILGSPIWLSILISLFAVILSVLISFWSVAVSLWAVFGSLVGSALGLTVGGIMFAVDGYGVPGLATISAGLVCAGLSIFMFYGCLWTTKGIAWLTKVFFKKCFVRKKEEML